MLSFEDRLKKLKKIPAEQVQLKVPDPFATAPFQEKILKYKADAARFKVLADEVEIRSEADEVRAVDISTDIRKVVKDLKKAQELHLKPFKAHTKAINKMCKDISDPLNKAIDLLTQKVGQFKARKDLQVKKQQKIIDDKTTELQKELDEEAKKSGVESVSVAPITVPEDKGISRGRKGGAVYQRSNWKAEVIDPDLVSREYCSPDMQKINDAVRAGIRKIKGIRIYEDEKSILRT